MKILFAAIAIAADILAICTLAGCRRPANPPSDTGVTHRDLTVNTHTFTVVQLDLDKASLQLFWQAPDGTRYANFQTLDRAMSDSHRRLLFAANAGIFEPGFTPTGLTVEARRELVPLNLKSGAGNFYLKPNGVFLIDDAGAKIIDTANYPGTSPNVRLATQSGPLLVLAGVVNAQFNPDSTSRQIRSGVGIQSPRQIVFVLSRQPFTFHEFATLFKDQLNCPDALYLDGGISQFDIPPLDPTAPPQDFAAMLAVTENDSSR